MDAGTVSRWLAVATESIQEHRDYLTQLDAAIGDADHGVNMSRGFAEMACIISEPGTFLTPGALLVVAGRTVFSAVGGASGALWGFGLQRAGRALGDVLEFDGNDLARVLEELLAGVVELGAAEEGDKTMVDTLAPASRALRRVVESGMPLSASVALVREEADAGMRATLPLRANKGRASYLGERSIGHQDPGATSAALILTALERTLSGTS
ncbi:MAG: dihydroxyacetone kinase subunit DhaL [Acidimicrobiales bacterium]